MAQNTFIYALVDPRTSQARYIGKADDLSKRLRGHLNTFGINTKKASWIKSLEKAGVVPEIVELECVSRDAWQQAECYWISYFKFIGAELTNGAFGGDGVIGLSGESLERIGAARRGIPRTEAVRKKLSKSCSGWKHSEEARAKISEAQTGRRSGPMSEEQKRKISKTKSGVPMSEAQKKRISDTLRGRIKSPEECGNISKAKRLWWAKRKATDAANLQ